MCVSGLRPGGGTKSQPQILTNWFSIWLWGDWHQDTDEMTYLGRYIIHWSQVSISTWSMLKPSLLLPGL